MSLTKIQSIGPQIFITDNNKPTLLQAILSLLVWDLKLFEMRGKRGEGKGEVICVEDA